MNSTQRSRDVFLSHRSTDKDFVRALADQIEKHDLRGRPLTYWLDEAEIRPGQSVTGMINEGLESSRFIALVMTPDYFNSPSGWTDAEWHAALYADPDGRRARVIPILAADCTVPFLLRHLGAIDLRGHNDDAEFARLIATLRDQPMPRPVTHRGQLISTQSRIDRSTLLAERSVPQGDPDVITERLYCNMLPVERPPRYVYAAEVRSDLFRTRAGGATAMPSKTELKEAIRSAQAAAGVDRPFMPAFRVFEDRVITFHDLEDPDNPMTAVIDEATAEALDVALFGADDDQRKIITSLLNMAVSRHMLRVGLVADDSKHQRFFYPSHGDNARQISWVPFRKKATRTVAKQVQGSPSTGSFWRHLGAYVDLLWLVNRYYVRISPTWVITRDGRTPRGGPDIGRIVSRWTSPERNLQLLYHVRFWTSVLRNRRSGRVILIPAGDQSVEVATVPAMIQQAYGVADDRRDLLQLLDQTAPELAAEEEELVDEAARVAAETSLDSESDLGDVIEEIGDEDVSGTESEDSKFDES
jgi:hypothetical protein